MQVQEALAQIDSIWSHVARTERFHGYRPEIVASTGVLGIVAAIGQSVACPDPMADPSRYLNLWVGIAVTCVIVVAAELLTSYSRCSSPLQRQLTRRAVLQFIPCLCAGAVVTWEVSTHSVRQLPGLWAICFSLGVFASLPFITPAILWVAGYYLLAGTICLSYSHSSQVLHPAVMGSVFGVGQLLMAWILWTSENRHHATK